MRSFVQVVFAAALSLCGVLLLHESSLYKAPAQPEQAFAPLATSTDASYNWSGYVAEEGGYTAVSATWVVPRSEPHPGAALSADAVWVGIGGTDTPDLIQAGTQALIDEEGRPYYSAWYELLPQASRPVPLRVKPGDRVTASITAIGEGAVGQLWHIVLLNNTTGASFAVDIEYASRLSSASWVVEMPSTARGRTFIPLSDFGVLTFESAHAVQDGKPLDVEQAGALPLRMTNTKGEPLAEPTALLPQGGFSVLRTDALATGLGAQRRLLLPPHL